MYLFIVILGNLLQPTSCQGEQENVIPTTRIGHERNASFVRQYRTLYWRARDSLFNSRDRCALTEILISCTSLGATRLKSSLATNPTTSSSSEIQSSRRRIASLW